VNDWTARNTETGEEWNCDSKAEAEERIDDVAGLHDPEDFEIVPPGGAKTDGGTETVEPEIVDHSETPEVSETDALDELGESLETDPLSILPGHMVDHIQGQPAVNKRGYAMIAERYGIEVSAEIEHYPWDNDEGRCVARATAVTDDGRNYSGWATACAEDGDMDDQIVELAETRALKRAISWASGVGIVSYVEMTDQLEGGQ
jgi:hypothetical protein